ncbi:Hypothetical protein R9X50_00711500 [Acrodontium crateriforme]|uniref:PUM-HD domain-containing protein n=1 Tax=Acrodontium crateriforme TaxID=150365 RepID=A0AAQ3MCK9_9PEZI|nr:Hypothetical protein R9X50_00711500 [Acrodontium crateriforme]
MDLTGSPQKKTSASFNIFEDKENTRALLSLKRSTSAMPIPLTTSKLINQLPLQGDDSPKARTLSSTRKLVLKLMDLQAQNVGVQRNPVDDLLSKLTEHQAVLSRQKQEIEESSSSTGTDPYATTPPTDTITHSHDGRPDAAEVFRLKKELELAKERMAQMDIQLSRERDERIAQAEIDFTQSQLARSTVEAAIGSPFPSAPHLAFNMAHQGPAPVGMNGHGRASPAYPNQRGLVIRRSFRWCNSSSLHSGHSIDPNQPVSRPLSAFGGYQQGYTPPITPLSFQSSYGLPNGPGVNRQHPPIGTRLSPTAADFSADSAGPWNAPTQGQTTTYMSTAEPLNYRRLLDRNMSCNWKYIVDKIVCNNDQQASIFLQQKLKVGTPEQKFEIVQAIIDQAYPLMVNRFGNFLVQRCFEHGTPEQVISIAQAIRGNTLNLSMDAFGCHVVQKAFDSVPEEYKAIMVHELLRRIPETVIHRYACHVWQKLFELRWSDSPPQIMRYVNEALRGMWHEVALGETGSLVVQNIFENCLEEDKRPCISEVLASIDVVAHGQFGNWCIQHICEHGSVPDRTRAVDHVIRFAPEYSMDQFASKVVEKCLKVNGTEFLDRYLDRVCEARPDRPRMPLIDIAGDQFGNYLIQYILTNADAQRREVVAAHIRKHMVSLRGSKYGSRVAMLCCNPAFATRPGPPTGLPPPTRHSNGNGRYTEPVNTDQPRLYALERSYGGNARGGHGGAYR